MSNPFSELPTAEGRGTLRGVLSNLGIVCAVFTFLAVSALFFTDITVSFQASLSFSLQFLILLFASYVMYFSLSETGADRAKQEKEYCEAAERARRFRLRFREEGDMRSLLLFCERVSHRETLSARRALLSLYGLSEEALTEKAPSATLSPAQKRGLIRVKRMRQVRITPSMLLWSREEGGYRPPLSKTPAAAKRRRFLPYLFASLFTAFFSVSVLCDIIVNPNPALLVGYVSKMFTLVFNGIKGYRAGYCNVAKDTAVYLEEQSDLLEEYFKDFLPSLKSDAPASPSEGLFPDSASLPSAAEA
ncbi:MAG: hypothetical protein IJY71_06235 [Clostridia bacterium]|nr:hypothetical protein [Clostridia bacterium]